MGWAASGSARSRRGDAGTRVLGTVIASLCLAFPAPSNAEEATQLAQASDLSDLSLEELANIDISSVSKRSEPLSQAPAAIYVITHDDIVRSGANTLPEILRLAPNLQVAQINNSTYAITARGFNGTAASNKLLVLIDGRVVYTPLFSGVLWNAQDTFLPDIDRVEVISGPGATLWGANAVNGVINIITRKSSETQGGMVNAGAGTLDRRASARYGGSLGDTFAYRFYVQGFEQRNNENLADLSARDEWEKAQGGFRFDWTPDADVITLQGDIYDGSVKQLTTANQDLAGHNVLGRWVHRFDRGSTLQVQAYYDQNEFGPPGGIADDVTTYDLDVQYGFSIGARHDFVVGGGYRVIKDRFTNIAGVAFVPANKTLKYGNVFVQDTIALSDTVDLTLGLKLEDDAYVSPELLPSARLAWRISETDVVWSAISRAVRSPSRIDRELFQNVGGVPLFAGSDFESEKLVAFEVGFRSQPTSRASYSVSTYYNVYDDLRSIELTAGGTPFVFGNGMEGNTLGIEIWGNYSVTDWWRLGAGVNWMHQDLGFETGSSGFGGVAIAGNDPQYQFSLRSSMNLGEDVTLDVQLRGVDDLPSPGVPSYIEMGARLGWAVSDDIVLSLTGSNLLHDEHLEFGAGPNAVEVGRSVFLNVQWNF